MSEHIPHSMSLYVLLTQAHCRIPILEAAGQVIRGGADVVQLREKDASDSEIIQLGRALRRMTAEAGVLFILNDRPDLARLIEADGCHLGQDDLPQAAARDVLAPGQILGVSTHSVGQARQAVADGADYIGVGPVFPTATKGYDTGVGLDYVRQAAAAVACPLIAIGGITADRAVEVIQAGDPARTGMAVCSAILGAEDIEAETVRFKTAIDGGI
jgi:thiamine-phosphate pyrophosphorylase